MILMRIRALLFLPALATAALGIGASSASAATLWTTNAHSARVTVGSTATADVIGNLDLTLPTGTVANRCTGGDLGVTVEENSDVRVSLNVTSGFFTGCTAGVLPTFPWTLTVTGNGTVVAPNIRWAAIVDHVAFDIAGFPGVFSGNLTTGVTAGQPTSGTTPITLNLADAGSASNPNVGTGFIDGNIQLTSAWSLTN
jgi:hypothetical protein